MSILLPKFLASFRHAQAIAICREIQDAEAEVVNLDASNVVFADPFALTLLGASFYELKQWGQRVRIAGLDPDIGGYLQRMDLFEDVEFVACAPPIGQRHDRRDALVELTRIDNSREAPEAAWRIAHALVGSTGLSDTSEGDQTMEAVSPADRLLQPIQYVLSELLENAVTHGQKHGFQGKCRVWVAAQYYPSKDVVRLAVTDTGCGFLATLRGHPDLGAETDFSAILTAMKPRVSCNRDLGISGATVNEGVGLTTVIRIADLADGKILIVSGNAYHKPRESEGGLTEGTFWQGVIVALEMRRASLQEVRIADALPQIMISRKVKPRFE